MLKVGSLFSGIGGFDLGLERAGFEIKWQVEINDFCQKILTKHWPKVPKFRDIRDCGKGSLEAVDLICGGFPCQPFSTAGKRKGKEDDRYLWPEMLRIISELQPTWVIGENVAGLVNLGLDDCLSDLENQGYETQAFIIPACAVNAPHRRDRVWIVAYAEKFDDRRMSYKIQGTNELQKEKRQKERIPESGCSNQKFAQDPKRHGRNNKEYDLEGNIGGKRDSGAGNGIGVYKKEIFTYAASARLEGTLRQSESRDSGRLTAQNRGQSQIGDKDWLKIAQRFCKLYDGLPYRLDGYLTSPETYGIMGFILTLREAYYAKKNEDRNKALFILHKALATESVSKFFRGFYSVRQTKILRCLVHGKSYDEKEKDKVSISENSIEAEEALLRKMREGRESTYSSYRYGLEKQCSCKFDDIVRELSSEIALGEWENNAKKAETYLFGLWKESRGERFLYEPLPTLYEIWKSVTDKEIGSFRRHYYHRDEDRIDRLKALGNAVVPQIPEIIGRMILESLCLTVLPAIKR